MDDTDRALIEGAIERGLFEATEEGRREGWRAGAEVMREAAAAEAERRERAYRPADPNYADGCKDTARDIRELTVPEMPNDR